MKANGNLLVCCLSALLVVNAAQASHLILHDTTLSLDAKDEPLREILGRFADAGVMVEVDPAIRTNISVSVQGKDIEQAIADLVSPFGYALVWNVVEGPLGSISRLERLRVFAIGKEQRVLPLVDNSRLNVSRGWNGEEFVADELLIAFKPGTSLDEFKLLLSQFGAYVVECDPALGIYRLRFPPGTNIQAMVSQLKNNEKVHAVEPNYVYRVPGERNPSAFLPDRLRAALPAADGAAPLAILDSGLQTMAGLENAVVGAFDAFNPEGSITDPVGHGTQMALVAAGAVTPEGDDCSEAPQSGVPLLAVKAFDSAGATSNFDLMRSLQYAAKNGARVVNLSWGSETPSEFLEQAMLYAQSKGMVVVASAGNDPSNQPVYPAACSGVLGVGALNGDGTVWENSNYGDFVDITAPGAAKFPVGHNGPPGSYAGTSVAGAQVSKTIAQYFIKNPEASAQQALNDLAATLSDAGEEGRDAHYGVGSLDCAAKERYLNK